MSDLTERAAANRAALLNPANRPGHEPGARKRIPMAVPVQKLQVPPIPGYFTYWMRGTPDRIQQALNAGYEWVSPREADINNFDLAGDADKSGNSDLGDRVSVLASTTGDGDVDASGNPVRLYLMKQKMEYHLEDQAIMEKRNASVAEALVSGYRTGTVGGRAEGETADDMDQRYVDTKRTRIPDLFKPKRQR